MNDKKIIKILFLIIFIFLIGPIIIFLLQILYKANIKEKNLQERYGKGTWIIITGASSGQGKYLAEQFAEREFNLILIGSPKTLFTANNILKKYPNCSIKIIIKDFSKSLENNWWDDIEKLFDGTYNISILVNNVGQRTASNPSHKQKDEDIRKSLITGTYPQIKLTKLCLEYMINKLNKNKQYKCGIIFNTAQCIHPTFLFSQYYGTGEISVPYLSVYEGANAFGFYHANSLISEYKLVSKDIDMLNIMPGAVITENTKYLKNTIFAVKAEKFSKNIIRLLGNWNGNTCAYWGHELSGLLIGVIPWKKEKILHNVGKILSENL
jgi:short-subunit dehydrogenase